MPINQSIQANFHENLGRNPEIQVGSNRAFGLVMATACFIIAGLGYFAATASWPFWSSAAIIFVLTTWLRPSLLSPLNRLWFRLGLLLHRVVTPVVMGLVFFVVITPMGLIMRACGNCPLELEFQRDAPTYWFSRNKSELQPGPMYKQY
jgi:hypothetical protein